jgi:hypothetical protein
MLASTLIGGICLVGWHQGVDAIDVDMRCPFIRTAGLGREVCRKSANILGVVVYGSR